MDYFLRYPDIKQKKSMKVKKFPVRYIFCDWAKNRQRDKHIIWKLSYEIFEIWSRNIFFISKS